MRRRASSTAALKPSSPYSRACRVRKREVRLGRAGLLDLATQHAAAEGGALQHVEHPERLRLAPRLRNRRSGEQRILSQPPCAEALAKIETGLGLQPGRKPALRRQQERRVKRRHGRALLRESGPAVRSAGRGAGAAAPSLRADAAVSCARRPPQQIAGKTWVCCGLAVVGRALAIARRRPAVSAAAPSARCTRHAC